MIGTEWVCAPHAEEILFCDALRALLEETERLKTRGMRGNYEKEKVWEATKRQALVAGRGQQSF